MPKIEDRTERAVACCWRIPAGRKVAHAVELLPGVADSKEIDRYRDTALCGVKPPRNWTFPVYVNGPEKRCKNCEVLYDEWGLGSGEKLPSAEPIEDYLWCIECNEPHRFDADKGKLDMDAHDDPDCPALLVYITKVEKLPENWEREYHAGYNDRKEGGGYLIIPKLVDPNPEAHFPMYYLASS